MLFVKYEEWLVTQWYSFDERYKILEHFNVFNQVSVNS